MHIFFSILLTLSFIVGSTHLSYAQDATEKKTKIKKSKSVSADSSEMSESFLEQLQNGESSNYGKIAAGILVGFAATYVCQEKAPICKAVATKTYDFVSNHVSKEQMMRVVGVSKLVFDSTLGVAGNILKKIPNIFQSMKDNFSNDVDNLKKIDANLADVFENNKKFLEARFDRIDSKLEQVYVNTMEIKKNVAKIQDIASTTLDTLRTDYDNALNQFLELSAWKDQQAKIERVKNIENLLRKFSEYPKIETHQLLMSYLILSYCYNELNNIELSNKYILKIVAYPRDSLTQDAQVKAIEKSIKSDNDRLEYEPTEMQAELTAEIKKKEVRADQLKKVNQLNISQEGFLVLFQDAIYEMLKSKFEKQPKELDKLERMRNHSLLNQIEIAETFDVNSIMKELSK